MSYDKKMVLWPIPHSLGGWPMNTEMQTDAARRVSSSSGRDSISGVHNFINIDSLNRTGWKHGCLMMQYQLQWLLSVHHDDRRRTYAYSD
jgi:hypothetical protein